MSTEPLPVPQRLPYALVTAARNEESLLENTLRSVEAQRHLPVRWIIVSDGSTDRTDEIVRSHAAAHPWIELLRMPEHGNRNFAAKARCFNAGYARLAGEQFDLVGNLDADITFGPDYYLFLVTQFAAQADLGVAGTPFVEDPAHPERHSYAHRGANLDHVSGACQMFRRACFEAIGGYAPIPGGGVDWLAVTSARMKGWRTRTFTAAVCYHHRRMGTAGRGALAARFCHGREDYYVGGHPLWQLFRGTFQMCHPPYVLGGIALLAGYCWSAICREPNPIPPDVRAYHRSEQVRRLRAVIGLQRRVNSADRVNRQRR